jgi:hypothetical protein
MPSPVSETSTFKVPFRSHDRTAIPPPAGVNLMALPSRFQNTWRRRSGSPLT